MCEAHDGYFEGTTYDYYIAYYIDYRTDWLSSSLALQSWMGICAQWRYWDHPSDFVDPLPVGRLSLVEQPPDALKGALLLSSAGALKASTSKIAANTLNYGLIEKGLRSGRRKTNVAFAKGGRAICTPL